VGVYGRGTELAYFTGASRARHPNPKLGELWRSTSLALNQALSLMKRR
jgi:hypothetical protein